MEHTPLAEKATQWVRETAKASDLSERSLAENALIPRQSLQRSLHANRELTLPEFERLAVALGRDPFEAVKEAVA